jgi:hypothetical protein
MTELSPGTRNILTEGARALAPSQAARDRIRAGVAARVAAPPGGDHGGDHGGGTAGATGSASAVLKGSLITIAAIGFFGGAVWLARRDRAPEPPASRPAVSAPAEPPAAVAPEPASARTPETDVKPPPDGRRAVFRRTARDKLDRRDPAPTRTDRAARRTEQARGGAASDLAREIQLIDRARRALAEGDPDRARNVLTRYRREIAAPQMQREALLLQAEAECAAARTDNGLRTLAGIEARWPGASGIAAVRAMCRETR